MGGNAQSYQHYGNPLLGQIRSDTWVDEQYEIDDIGTEPYLFWRVRAVSRVVKVSRALRVQVEVTRIEDVHGNVLARNATPVNSGTAPYATQVSPWAKVSPYEFCLEFATHSPLRVRTLFLSAGRTAPSAGWAASVRGPTRTAARNGAIPDLTARRQHAAGAPRPRPATACPSSGAAGSFDRLGIGTSSTGLTPHQDVHRTGSAPDEVV